MYKISSKQTSPPSLSAVFISVLGKELDMEAVSCLPLSFLRGQVGKEKGYWYLNVLVAGRLFKGNCCYFMLTGFKTSQFCSEELKRLFRYPFTEKVRGKVLVMPYRKTFLTLLC